MMMMMMMMMMLFHPDLAPPNLCCCCCYCYCCYCCWPCWQGEEDASVAAAAREICAGGGLSLLCIDADSKDAGLGMSAPPQEFTSDVALDDMYVPPALLLLLLLSAATL
jgi:hypothetical protein